MPGGWWCCRKDCSGCTDCCADGMPNSLDITFGSGWTEPTVDVGKMGCDAAYTDICSDSLDGQTFNLPSVGSVSPGFCHAEGGIAYAGFCAYQYVDVLFCQPDFSICDPGFATLNLWAWFKCQESGLCRIEVKLEICASCGFGPVKTGRSDWWWKTADFALGGEVCAGLSKAATWMSRSNYDYADTESFCVWSATPANRTLTVDDGG